MKYKTNIWNQDPVIVTSPEELFSHGFKHACNLKQPGEKDFSYLLGSNCNRLGISLHDLTEILSKPDKKSLKVDMQAIHRCYNSKKHEFGIWAEVLDEETSYCEEGHYAQVDPKVLAEEIRNTFLEIIPSLVLNKGFLREAILILLEIDQPISRQDLIKRAEAIGIHVTDDSIEPYLILLVDMGLVDYDDNDCLISIKTTDNGRK